MIPATPQFVLALQIAQTAHAGQVEEYRSQLPGGPFPYVDHLARVMKILVDHRADAGQSMHYSDQMLAVAWLHDVIEDCPDWTAARLSAYGINAEVIDSVLLLTRAHGVSEDDYAAYIERIATSGDSIAIKVKRADLQDHLRDETRDVLPPSLELRYVRAQARLRDVVA